MSEFSTWRELPQQTFPTMPLTGLTDEERALVATLESVGTRTRTKLLLNEAYYLGEQIINNLRIAIPKELEFLRTIVGWPAMAVDPYVERLHLDGFRTAGATEVDTDLQDILHANGFDSEQSLAYTDALSMGRAYWTIGSPLEAGGAPVITVDSPLNMSVLWDLRGTSARAAMQEYWSEGRRHGAILVPGKTITMAHNDSGAWEVVDRDEHGFDFVPVVRMPHRPRTHERDGHSAITPALRSITDAACRTLLGLEVARELYSVPQKVILGATESDFQNSDGTAKTAWETYITRTLALERDDEGNLPEIRQMTPYDPASFTKLLDWYASSAAGLVAAPPQDLGLYTQGNPASAEAVTAGESRRDRRAENMQQMFGTPLAKVAQYAMRFANGGELPDTYKRLEPDWTPVAKPTPATSDGVTKEITAGLIPATSEVALKKLGYSAVDRQRIAQERDEAAGHEALKGIAEKLGGTPAAKPAPSPKDVFGGKTGR